MNSQTRDEATLRAYFLKVQAEREAFLRRPPVVMCGCRDWLTCDHPWPVIASFPPVRDRAFS